MTDVLSGGSDRPPRRGSAVALGVAAAVVATVAVAAGAGLGPGFGSGPTAGASRHAPPPPTTSPMLSSPPHATGDTTVEPRLAGISAGVAADVRLVVGGPRPVALGAQAPRLGGLAVPAGWEAAQVMRVPAGLIVVIRRLQLSNTEASSRVYLVGPDGAASLLAAGDEAVAAVDGAAVYVVRNGAPDADGSGIAAGWLSKVSLSGRVLDRHVVSAGFVLQADTDAGLLVAAYRLPNGPADLQIVDGHTLAVRKRVGEVDYVLGASRTVAAWTTPRGCPTTCALVVADLTSGARRTVTLASGYAPGPVAFSPDGRHVAVSYYGRHPQQAGGAAPGAVDVIDLATGSRQRLPGVGTAEKQAADLAWTPDGQWLAVAVGWPDSDFRRIGLWPATGGPVHVLPGRFAGGYLSGALLAV